MNGVKYYRIQRGLTQKELIQRAGICQVTLTTMEHVADISKNSIRSDAYEKLRTVLHVPIDELLRVDLPDVEDEVHVRNMRPEAKEYHGNCIGSYRKRHRLTYRELAAILRVSHESVRKACLGPEPPWKYICRLAEREGSTPESFMKKYGGGEDDG